MTAISFADLEDFNGGSTVNVTKQVRIDKDNLDVFNRLYPDLLNLYVNRAIICAISNRADFDKIFFTPLLNSGIVKE